MKCAYAGNGNFCDLEAALSVQSDVHDAITNVFNHPEGTFPPVSSHAPVTFPPVSHPDVTFPPVSHSDGCHENKMCFWNCLKHQTPTPTPTTTAGALPLSLLMILP